MADYILDTTVVISYFIQVPHTANATTLFKQLKANDRLLVPEFSRLECVNVIWKYVRFQNLPQAQAEQNIKDLLALPLKIVPITNVYVQAFQIGLTHQLAIYDAIYIALAKNLTLPLISVDQSQIRAASLEGVIVKPITDFMP
jgi:predicted nucleic acid-binding protein